MERGEFCGEEDMISSIGTFAQDPPGSAPYGGQGRIGQANTRLALNSLLLQSFSAQGLPETEVISLCLVTTSGLSSFGLNGNFSITSSSKECSRVITFPGKRNTFFGFFQAQLLLELCDGS